MLGLWREFYLPVACSLNGYIFFRPRAFSWFICSQSFFCWKTCRFVANDWSCGRLLSVKGVCTLCFVWRCLVSPRIIISIYSPSLVPRATNHALPHLTFSKTRVVKIIYYFASADYVVISFVLNGNYLMKVFCGMVCVPFVLFHVEQSNPTQFYRCLYFYVTLSLQICGVILRQPPTVLFACLCRLVGPVARLLLSCSTWNNSGTSE